VTGGGTAGKVTRVDPPARAVAAEDVDIHLLRGAHGKMRVLLTGDHQLVFAAVVSSYAGTTGFDRLVRSLHLTY
jgi:hypothetical protein